MTNFVHQFLTFDSQGSPTVRSALDQTRGDKTVGDTPIHAVILRNLKVACSAGNLQTILEEWKSAPDREPQEQGVYTNHFSELQTALEHTIRNGQIIVTSYLLGAGFRITSGATSAAIETRSTATLDVFMQHGWDTRWPFTKPVIIRPIQKNDIELVKWFLSRGASAHKRHNRFTSSTPLTTAVTDADLDMVKFLVANDGRVEHGNLLVALSRSELPNRLPVLAYLVENGAPVNRLEHSHSPRIFARKRWQGLGTPLHSAVEHNRLKIAQALLAFGADPTIKDTKDRTPLDLARELKLPEMIGILEWER